MLSYVIDEELRQETNQKQENYWEIYLREICNQLGVKASILTPKELENPDLLRGIKSLILGHQSGTRLSQKAREGLEQWVQEGGILLGFATKGLDRIFGIESQAVMTQTPDDCTISGYFDMTKHPMVRGIHPYLYHDQKLIILSDIQLIAAERAVELCRLYDAGGRDLGQPAVTWHEYGKGYAGFFAFDAAKTVWLLHQGRSVADIPEEAVRPQSSALQVLGENSRKVLYADEIVLLMQNMIAQTPQPFIYQIPPDGEKIPEALFYWSGDEYFGPSEVSLKTSDWMKEKGLPLHINIGMERTHTAKDGHPMTREELQHIQNNGHEISLYYMLFPEEDHAITEETIQYQSDLFYERFGFRPGCTLMFRTRWKGWAEPARWMAKAGGRADNGFGGFMKAYNHPTRNAPFFGFGYGTGYPFFFYDDADHGNERIEFLEQPITCYEIGHRCLSGTDRETETRRALPEVHLPIDMAVKYHLAINFFYHPPTIVKYASCREAIEEILRYLEYRNVPVMHMGCDQLCDWWFARDRSRTEKVVASDDSLSFASQCEYPGGMIVKFRLKDEKVPQVLCDGQVISSMVKEEFGGQWLYLVVPAGTHQVSVHYNER